MTLSGILNHINQISAASGLIFACILFIFNVKKKRSTNLENLLSVTLGGGVIPTGIVLLLCAFDRTLIKYLSDFNMHVALAGLALIYIAIKTINANL